MSEDRSAVRFTARAAPCDKLKLAQDLLRHAVPGGELSEVVDRALTVLLDDLARKKCGASSGPDAPTMRRTAAQGTRHVPSLVKRAVWIRDGGCCAFKGIAGRRCGARAFLEFHHVEPFAAGGPATVENIELRCRAHNAYEKDLYFAGGYTA